MRGTWRREARAFLGAPLTTHRLQEADVLPERANAAAEGEQEHKDAHHDQQDGWVHGQAGQCCFWGKGLSLSLSLVPVEGGTREGWGAPKTALLPWWGILQCGWGKVTGSSTALPWGENKGPRRACGV